MDNTPDAPGFPSRINHGAPLEPEGGILHGAGQDFETWKEYACLMEKEGLRPDMFMAYCGLRGLASGKLEQLKAYTALFPDNPPLAQLGLAMTVDGQPEKCYAADVAKGACDSRIRCLGEFFSGNQMPVLLRIGYECTGPWNGYEAESFVDAFRHVAGILRTEFSFPLATVWCVEGGWTEIADQYYPGDDWVDWWSVDLFSTDHFEKSAGFMEKSLQHGMPVLVGECTPRRVGVQDGELSWETWYKPFFAWMARWRNVKGFSYINWEWSGYEQWKDWGDARIQENPFVLSQWKDQLKRLPRSQS